jgi:HTH-type transcriptional regulator / antitoxin HigA
MTELHTFQPNWASAPGDTIADVLEEKKLSLAVFSKHIGCSIDETKDLLAGRIAMTLILARKLESELGSSVEFWMSRDFHYRDSVTRLGNAETKEWLADLPIGDMVRFGWIRPVEASREVAACLRFFDVPDIQTWHAKYASLHQNVAFRSSPSFESREGAVAAWLRQGEMEARSMRCKSWNPDAFATQLTQVRGLTRQKNPSDFVQSLRDLCAPAGVAVVIVRAPNGCRASGATRFLSDRQALLQLSFRYLSDDQFWFSFFHEAGHLLLHGRNGFFLEGIGTPATPQEDEASAFAERILVPPEWRDRMLALGSNSREVIRFARRLGISPGIVVGQLQHYGRVKRSHLNGLKRRFTWSA